MTFDETTLQRRAQARPVPLSLSWGRIGFCDGRRRESGQPCHELLAARRRLRTGFDRHGLLLGFDLDHGRRWRLPDRPPVAFAELEYLLEREARAGMGFEPKRAGESLAATGTSPRARREPRHLVD